MGFAFLRFDKSLFGCYEVVSICLEATVCELCIQSDIQPRSMFIIFNKFDRKKKDVERFPKKRLEIFKKNCTHTQKNLSDESL